MSGRADDRYSRREERLARYGGRSGDDRDEATKGRYVRDYRSDRLRRRDSRSAEARGRSRSRRHRRDGSRERPPRRARSRRGSRSRSSSVHSSSVRRRGEAAVTSSSSAAQPPASRMSRFETVDYQALFQESNNNNNNNNTQQPQGVSMPTADTSAAASPYNTVAPYLRPPMQGTGGGAVSSLLLQSDVGSGAEGGGGIGLLPTAVMDAPAGPPPPTAFLPPQLLGPQPAVAAPPSSSPAPMGAAPVMTPAQVLELLQQQQQQQQQSPPPQPSHAQRVAAVEDFIPVVPKSLLGLIGGNSSASAAAHAGQGTAAAGGTQPLVVLEAPKIAPEAERQTREARRAHLSGFPRATTQAELLYFFRLLIPEVRRVMTQREIAELAAAAGDPEDSVRQLPPDAQTDVDEIRELTINMAKTKPFAFLELSLPDIITEMIDECQKDPERFVFTAADGGSYAILIRRPRDYVCMPNVDPTKLVMVGFPPTLPEEKLRATFENFGALLHFSAKRGMAYAEFANAQDAVDCRTDLHGEVLGRRVVLVLPLYDWLKVICVEVGIDITLDDDDPVSGKSLLHNLQSARPALLEGGGGAEHSGEGGGALVVRGESPRVVDHMKEMLEMVVPLPDVVGHLAQTYPHLRSLFRNAHVAIYPTRVLVLLNLFDEEELVLDESYSGLLAEIEAEVEQYGLVEELIVPRRTGKPHAPQAPTRSDKTAGSDAAAQRAEEEAYAQAVADYEAAKTAFQAEMEQYMERQIHPVYGGYGKVFVVYATADEASYAQQQIAGKMFGNRTVVTSFLFEDLLSLKGDAPAAGAEAHSAEPSEAGSASHKADEDNEEERKEEVEEKDEAAAGQEGEAVEDID